MLGLKIHANPKFSDAPAMIAALPDMGNVSGIGTGFLAKMLNARLFAEIYAYWPPFVTYRDGLVDYSQATYKFYSVDEKNLVIFTGDFNPTDPRRLYDICYEVLKMAERMNVKVLYSMAGALRQSGPVVSEQGETRVFGAVNRPEMLEFLKKAGAMVLQGEGQIIGFNGLVLGLARERGINALCVLGEIDNPNIIQPKTAQAVLKVMTRILGLDPFDMTELEEEEKRKKFMEKQMNYFEKVIQRGGPPGIG